MSATVERWPGSGDAPWTDDRFAPGDRSPDTELSPYRVRIGDEVYDETEFTADRSNRYHNFTSGIGAGKTVAGIIRMAANVQSWNPGELGMIITPTSLGIKNVILPELSKWGFLDTWTYRGPQSEQPGLHAPNGTRVLLESADNDRKIERLRGPSIAWFWMDEAALIPEKAWRILVGRLRAGQYRNAWITTTPKGENWVYDKFVNEESRLDSVNNVLGVPSYANPHLALDYRRDILDEYEGRFYDQEVHGEFTAFEGLVYPWFDDDHLLDSEDVPQQYDEVVYGVDWGHNNPAVVLALLRRGDQWIVADEWYERRCTTGDQAAAAEEIVDEYGEGTLYCDPSEPSNIHEFRRDYGLPAEKALHDVSPGIRKVSEQQGELLVSRGCQNVRNEFNQYQYQDGGDSDDPLKQHDHAMDALRYALFTHARRGGDTVTRSKHSLGGIT